MNKTELAEILFNTEQPTFDNARLNFWNQAIERTGQIAVKNELPIGEQKEAVRDACRMMFRSEAKHLVSVAGKI